MKLISLITLSILFSVSTNAYDLIDVIKVDKSLEVIENVKNEQLSVVATGENGRKLYLFCNTSRATAIVKLVQNNATFEDSLSRPMDLKSCLKLATKDLISNETVVIEHTQGKGITSVKRY